MRYVSVSERCKGRIPRHRHRLPRKDRREDVGVVECGLNSERYLRVRQIRGRQCS